MIHMQIIPPGPKHHKYTLRFTNHDGRRGVKVYAYPKKRRSEHLAELIIALIDAKHHHEAAPSKYAHMIASLPDQIRDRLTTLGLLERRRVMAGKPISEHIDAFEQEVAARGQNTAAHAKRQTRYVRRVCDGLHIERFDDISQSDAMVWLNGLDICATTRRQHLIALADFCRWMVRDKRAAVNPWIDIPLPKANSDTPRRAFAVDEFRRLLDYLTTFERYDGQKTGWTARDRRMVYWFAASTGLRQNEIRTRRMIHLHLDESPAIVNIGWKDAKNRRTAMIPLPSDLTAELKAYTALQSPNAPVFPLPKNRYNVGKMFERDLIGAGIPIEDDAGKRLDFHALRTTAIVWWLDVYGLSVKRAANLARCSERTVERYARGFRLNDWSFLESAPDMTSDRADEMTA